MPFKEGRIESLQVLRIPVYCQSSVNTGPDMFNLNTYFISLYQVFWPFGQIPDGGFTKSQAELCPNLG